MRLGCGDTELHPCRMSSFLALRKQVSDFVGGQRKTEGLFKKSVIGRGGSEENMLQVRSLENFEILGVTQNICEKFIFGSLL